MTSDRRTFLQLVSTGALAAAFPASIKRALAIPAHHRTGTIADVEHIVILMQENRSFDHYFGTLRGVRGFGDPRAIALPSGQPVWYQPNGDGYVLPFHPGAPNLGLQFLEDLAHDWTDTHEAWNGGKYDQWVPAKGTTTMAYLTRDDIPFHYALADAFTICDAYHCSLLGPTDPTAITCGPAGSATTARGGGPVLDNAEAGYDWSTYPRAAAGRRHLLEDLSGPGRGPRRRALLGLGRGRVHRQLRRQLAALLPPVPERAAGQPALREARCAAPTSRRAGRCFDQFKQDVHDRQRCRRCRGSSRPRRITRAPELAGELRRLVRRRRSSTRSRRIPRSGARRRSS